ncbi:MAG: hypothetical protein JW751_19425 [Polyangiaceae bacterium]|nr:hypothetical protein [Polyangiaceae bacterium]
MRGIVDLAPPVVQNVRISIEPPSTLRISGIISTLGPDERLAAFFRQVHELTCSNASADLRLDVSGLTFVNSSAIRLFVDWTVWLRKEPDGRRYLLRVLTDRSIAWQRTSFSALLALAPGFLTVEDAS